jgi:predicted RNA-binding Zn-ribbon protein involved in translation (DUF1610 family)
MTRINCPGQDTMFWRPGDIFDVACSKCGNIVEFFKDDASRRCPRCGNRIINLRLSLGCAQWCEHAKECLGFDPKELQVENDVEDVALVDQIIKALKKEFRDAQKSITRAIMVLEKAKELLREEDANPRVVLSAALLYNLKDTEAERIMKELDLDEDTIDHVCRIIGSLQSEKEMDSKEASMVGDAVRLVSLKEERAGIEREALVKKIEDTFRTKTGKQKAYELLARTDQGG